MPDCPLIPRRAPFGNPERSAPRISPDGRHLSWQAPRDGVMNIWVAPVGDLPTAVPLTRAARPIWSAWWAHDGRHLLYFDDTDGDENARLWAVDRDGGEPRRLTPERGVAAGLLALSPDRPGLVAVTLNDRDPAWHDVWLVDIATGECELLFENGDRYGGYVLDATLSLRLLTRWDDERGERQVFRFEAGEVAPAFDIPHEDDFGTAVLGFERDGARFLMSSSVGRDTGALFRVEAATGERHLLAENSRSDLVSCLRDPTKRFWTRQDITDGAALGARIAARIHDALAQGRGGGRRRLLS